MANTTELRSCLQCGKPLPPQQGRGRVRHYCSDRCRDRARRQNERASVRALAVKEVLTKPGRHGYLDINAEMSDSRDPLTAKIAGAAKRLVGELDQPGSHEEAVAAARELSNVAEEALQATVDRAREDGQTWRDIGRVLGTSRQAAFQRFGRVAERSGDGAGRALPPGSLERVTEFVSHFLASDWEEVVGYLSESVRPNLDAERLASGWSQMISRYGSYESTGKVSPIAFDDGVVIDLLLRFEAGEAMLWARFDSDGKISGLRLHPASI